ncbi:hypothetical protein AVEN_212690-1, partial [Araneus ventricosus]
GMHSVSSQTETFTDVSDRMTKLKDELKELQDSLGKKAFIPENISNDTQMKALTSFTKERFSCVYSFLNVEEDLQTGNFYGWYVSAPEAMWRLNEFNLSEKSHTVVRLVVHLPDQQAIVYQDGQEEEAVARTATRQTTLTTWFELNKNDQDSHNYLYTDIPHYYTFNNSAMKWPKR